MARMSMNEALRSMQQARSENPETGVEAIQYFAKQGEAAKLKFIYCIREAAFQDEKFALTDEISPYELRVVDADTAVAHGEHFIMSTKGLVHQVPGSPSDFIPVHEWVRGSVNFKVVRALKTFKMAKVIKTFRAWAKFTRQGKFHAKRSVGIGRSFIATEAFCPAIMRINGLLRDMAGIQLADGFKHVKSVAQSYHDGEFMRVQESRRMDGKEAIETISGRIQDQVEAVCGEVSRRAEVGQGLVGTDGRRKSVVEIHAEKMAEAKHMSIHEAKMERLRKKQQQMRWEAERASLASFVRYIDQMLVATLLGMCEHEAKSLCNLAHATERVGLFEATVRFDATAPEISFREAHQLDLEGIKQVGTEIQWTDTAAKTLVWPYYSPPRDPRMKFSPNSASVQAMFLEVLNGIKSALADIPRIISSPSLAVVMKKQHTNMSKKKKLAQHNLRKSKSSLSPPVHANQLNYVSVEQLLRESLVVQSSREKILSKVSADFSESTDISTSFSYLRGIFDFDRIFSADAWLSKANEDGTNDSNIMTEIQGMLYMADVWTERLTKGTKNGQAVGVVHIETKTLQRELAPAIKLAMETACVALQRLGERMCTEQLKTYRQRLATMESEPTSLHNFSEHLDKLNSHRQGLQKLKQQDALIDEIYGELKRRAPKLISTDEAVQHDELHLAQTQAEEQLIFAIDYVDKNLEDMKVRLDAGVIDLEEKCRELQVSLGEGDFCSADNDPAAVCELLEEAHQEIQRLGVKATNFTKTRHMFEMRKQEQANALLNSSISGKKQTKGGATLPSSVNVVSTSNDSTGDLEKTLQHSGPFADLSKTFERRKELWESYRAWREKRDKWLDADLRVFMNVEHEDAGPFGKEYDGEAFLKDVENTYQEGVKLARSWKGDPVASKFREELRVMRQRSDFISQLGHPSLLSRHWREIFQLFGVHTYDDELTEVTIKALEQYDIYEETLMENIDSICGSAGKEYSLLKAMDKMEEEWKEMRFECIVYKETGTSILRKLDEVEQLLDDQIVRAQAMRGSRFIGPLKPRVEAWEKKLNLLSDILEQWLAMQGTWLYLEPIFSSEDICKQMPAEAKRFATVDQVWRSNMEATNDSPECMAATERDGLLGRLKRGNKLLDEIQKGLADYLNQKRVFFPRFFFLSNDEMLEILSETKDPLKVEPHLKKCFEGIAKLQFDKNLDILAMISSEKENVPFPYEDLEEKIINPGDARGCVEIWLDQIQGIMRKTVAYVYDRCMEDYAVRESKGDRTGWLQSWPGQVVLGVSQTFWTTELTKALNEKGADGAREYAAKHTQYIQDIIRMVRDPSLSKLVRKTVSPLCVLDVHSRDVTLELAEKGIESAMDFDWLCQLRYYHTPGGESAQTGLPASVSVQMINAERLYGYEYLGNSMRLVITPLTDRCYRTLMTAIHLDYGGAPAGPAGTGKTETTKDLGKAIAIQTVVYNCSDSLDYKAMGKFFKGLAGTGAWSCFDEFNRITLEVLSVVAQQILTIISAKKAKLDVFDFEGEMIKLRRTCNVFVTMNPGYAGRQELPDNLKALMRSVAMMVPDYAMIGQIILYSMGYLEGKALANKIVMTYTLCSQQLSNQRHYDYGMRAVVAVLRASGSLKRKFPDRDESILCLQAIIDVNLPKFLAPDVPLFEGIVSDLFPGIKLPEIDRTDMRNIICKECNLMGLQTEEYFITKVFEIYQMLLVRHGFMVVGLPFGGKSNALKVLARTLTTLHKEFPDDSRYKNVHYTVINPKSITMGHLYGEFDQVSHEWTDGVLAISYRNYASSPPKVGGLDDLKWVWFDGPVDAIWIENMNTVLDDNKKLCLMNGEMVIMSSTMSMIFEPINLDVASPATVSRVGVIYMEPFRMGWRPCLASWLDKHTALSENSTKVCNEDSKGNLAGRKDEESKDPEEGKSAKGANDESATAPGWKFTPEQRCLVELLFEYLVDPCLCFVRRMCVEQAPTFDQTLVLGLLRLMESILDENFVKSREQTSNENARKRNKASDNESDVHRPQLSDVFVESCFMFSLVWSIGTTIDAAGRDLFSAFVRAFIQNPDIVEREEYKGVKTQLLLREWKNPLGKGQCREFLSPLPNEGTIYDYSYAPTNDAWSTWDEIKVMDSIPADEEYLNIVVQTTVTAQLQRLMYLLITHKYPPLIIGPTGTGKSTVTSRMLNKILPQETYKSVSIAFTARTTAKQWQGIVDASLDKRRRGIYGPPLGCVSTVFIDDLNMPEVEEYGAQPPLELLRQLIDSHGWFDLETKDFHEIVDTQVIAAMGPPGGGRNHISPRVLRHFSVICLTEFTGETMSTIYDTILKWHFDSVSMPSDVADLATKTVAATLNIYQESTENLLPTPAKSHYTFNLRDFSRVIQGLCLVRPYEGFGATEFVRLWAHESARVIMDRLVSEDDQKWFLRLLKTLVEKHFSMDLGKDIIGHLDPSGEGEANLIAMRNLFFGNYQIPDAEIRKYEEVKDVGKLVNLMEEYLEQYNSESKKPMDLVMFVFAVEHVSRIARVISMPSGNMLLVGVGGSGRQSLTRLAAFAADYSLKQIELSKNYGIAEWQEDLKDVISRAGTSAKPIVFLFSDTQVKYESFIEDINSMLNTGQVPNLFAFDERVGIIDGMRDLWKKQSASMPPRADGKKRTEPGDSELWEMFLTRTRSQLHIVLAFSPIGSAFRERLRKYPSLVNCCTIDWFFAWPSDALIAVAEKFLASVDMDESSKGPVVRTCQFIHTSVRKLSEEFKQTSKRINYVTPTSYLELIRSFQTSLGKVRGDLVQQRARYETGLEKLGFASSQVSEMQTELSAMLPGLEIAKKETAELMDMIQQKLPGAKAMEQSVGKETKVVQMKADSCAAMKKECEDDLSVAIPLLESAMKALDTLKKSDLDEVKNMKSPPSGVRLVMAACCVMFKVKPQKKDGETDYWTPAKKELLGDMKFLQRLKDYDKDHISPKIIKILRKSYVNNPEFEPERIKRASVAAFGLCKWVTAMEAYDRVAKVVEPKRQKLAASERELEATMETLRKKQDELAAVQNELATLNSNLAKAKAKKAQLEKDVDLCEKKLKRAKQLIDGLGGEQTRWSANVNELTQQVTNATGDVLVSSGLIAYLGAFTTKFREKAIKGWAKVCFDWHVPCSSNPSLLQTLGDPIVIRQWNLQGLPTDAFSVDNGIVVFNSRRWPLMIDPEGQANTWVRNMEKSNKLKVVKQTDNQFMRTIENAVQFGAPVLLENVGEELDPTLEPLLQKLTFKQGGVICIRLGDNTVEYSEHFRFYITTKYRNPHYLPEVAVKVTLLNFMITPAGLQDQLLAIVVQEERPELAVEKEKLLVEGAEMAAQLANCENEILHVLSNSEGNILEDASAISALNNSKEVSTTIKEKQAIVKETEAKIDGVREQYVPVAKETQVQYFCIADLVAIEPTYQYALRWFSQLFVSSIRKAEKPSKDSAEPLKERIGAINAHFMYSLYCNICRSLLEKDKLLFSFSLTTRLMQSHGNLPPGEFYFLLTGGAVIEHAHANPAPDWISSKMWGEIVRLSEVNGFGGLMESVAENPDVWRELYDTSDAHKHIYPFGWYEKLTPFQRLLQLAMFLDLYDEIPFKALNYCTGQCNYGGRVTDDKDRRCLVTLLRRYFHPDTLKPGCKLSPDGEFMIPPDGDYDSYISYINSLPMVVSPKVFGFHENASITKDQASTNLLMSSMLACNRSASTGDSDSGGGDSSDDPGKKKEVQSQDDLAAEVAGSTLAKFGDPFDMEFATLRYPVDWGESMNTVICQELERFNGLTNVIKQSLKDVQGAIKGTIVMSSELEKLASSLFFGLVPSMWMDASYPSLKPLASYVSDLMERLEFMDKWLNGSLPSAYWISGFFFTQAFLTGTLQNFARKYQIPIDDISYDFEIMEGESAKYLEGEKPENGAYIYGLFLDGARWDKSEAKLSDSFPKQLFSVAPVIWLKPSKTLELSKYPHYTCPVYKTSERRGMLSTTGASTNFVMMIRIPSDRPEDFWIAAGIAMLCSLSY
eukprot:g2136.t1